MERKAQHTKENSMRQSSPCLQIFALFCLIVALSCPLARGQAPVTGLPKFGSFTGGPDMIDLANLNMHLDIPVVRKTGRGGLNFNYDLSYDNSVWQVVTSGSSKSWQPVSGSWGWRSFGPCCVAFVTYAVTYTQAQCYNGGPVNYQEWQFNNFVYHDPYGNLHSFGASPQYFQSPGGANCPPNGPNPSTTQPSYEGAGYTLYATPGPGTISAYLTASDGSTINPPAGTTPPTSGSLSITDRNGNVIGFNNGSYTDTLGANVLTIAGTAPTSTTYTYTPPAGGVAAYTVKYATYSVQTNFAAPGISEYGPINNSLVSEIDLPDGSKYTFTYESTAGLTGKVTGRLASVTLPTGGTITYQWPVYSSPTRNGIWSDGSAVAYNRVTPDATWYFNRGTGTNGGMLTLVSGPDGMTLYQFQGIYETERQVYQGQAPAPYGNGTGTLLETVDTCYNFATSPCIGTAVSTPISHRDVDVNLGGQVNHHAENWDPTFGVPTWIDDYNFGVSSHGALIKRTLITYAPLGAITNLPKTVTICNGTGTDAPACNTGGGTLAAQTTYNYDEGNLTGTSGVPQHVSVSGSRGNLTSVNYPVGALTSHFTYDDTGTMITSKDVNNALTTYSSFACNNTFPTSVTEPLTLSRSMTWNCTGGLQLTATDENSKIVTTAYNDADYWRPASVTDQIGNITNFYYQPNPTYSSFETAAYMTFNNNTSVVSDIQYQDGLGRTYVRQHWQSPNSTSLDSVSYTYDYVGRPYTVSQPCSIGYAATCSTPKTTQTYDALSRPIQTTDAGGGTITNAYTKNDVLVTVGPAPSGENTKRRQLEYDALGRLTSVCELSSASGSGQCGQTVTQTGFWTKYSYDALGNLLTVTQNAQATAQTRNYHYDAMRRLTSETNPESGTTTYTYDSDTTCGTSTGDLVKLSDANGNTICNAYDSLHRVTSTIFSGPNAANQQGNSYFLYDSATVNGQAMQNGKTRLVEAFTAACSTCSKITDEGFSYTARGEVSDTYQMSPHSGGYYHSNATYWANGALNQLTGPNTYSAGWNVDGEGRISSNHNTGTNPLSSTIYNTASQPTRLNYVSGDNDSFTFDPNTNRMTQYQFNLNTSSLTATLGWNANGTLRTQNITDAFNAAGTQSCTYQYDDVIRITSANCGAAAAQTFSFDAFGNISKSGSPFSFQPSYSSSTNRMTAIGGFTPTYDANGKVLNDNAHTYSWNVSGQPVTMDSVSSTYDALGRVVEQNRAGTYTEFAYSPTGFKMQILTGQTAQKSFVPLAAGAMAVYVGSTLTYIHPDWLGSARLGSTSSRTMSFDVAYAPFGETYANSGSTDPSFTRQRQDTVAGLYDFQAREYSTQGRWPSPDPAGLAAVNPSNPQSWNRYAYVLNNPLALVDPRGLSDCPDLKAQCGDIFGDPNGAPGVDLFGFAPGCDVLQDIECETNREIANDISAENRFGFTALRALQSASADFIQSIDEDNMRLSRPPGGKADTTIVVGCTGSLDAPLCFPLAPYAPSFAPGFDRSALRFSPYEKFFIRQTVRSTPAPGEVLTDAYNRVPFANILTYNGKLPGGVCTVGNVAIGGLAIATVANPELFEATGPTAAVVGAVLLIGCD